MSLVIQSVRLYHFSKELLKDKDVIIFKVAVNLHDFVLLLIFFERIAFIIKSWDIIY